MLLDVRAAVADGGATNLRLPHASRFALAVFARFRVFACYGESAAQCLTKMRGVCVAAYAPRSACCVRALCAPMRRFARRRCYVRQLEQHYTLDYYGWPRGAVHARGGEVCCWRVAVSDAPHAIRL